MSQLKDDALKSCEDFWKEVINSDIQKSTFRDKMLDSYDEYLNMEFMIPKEISQEIFRICNNSNVGIYIYIISAVNYILKVYSGNSDVVIGTDEIIKERKHNNQYAKILMLKSTINDESTFKDFLSQIKEMLVNINKFNNIEIQQIQQLVGIEEFDNKTAIIDTVVRLKNICDKEIGEAINVATIFDFRIEGTNLFCSINYNTNSVSDLRIKDIKDKLIRFLKQTSQNTSIKLKMIEMMSESDKNKLFVLGQGKNKKINSKVTLHDLFEQQVEKTPNNIAVKYLSHELTYYELNNKANEVAKKLIESGLKTEEVVGLYFDRSIEMIIAMIGTLKAGGYYLPINIDNPTDRVKYLVNDSDVKWILTNNACKVRIDFINEKNKLIIDSTKSNETIANPKLNISSESLAYVIYTSGTTGKPKGTMIKHKNVINLTLGLQDSIYDNYEGSLNITCLAPYYFDASVQQIFMALINGHKLIIPSENEKLTGNNLLEFYSKNKIDISDGTPSHISMITDALIKDDPRLNVKRFIIGGEKLNYSLVKKFYDKNDKKEILINNVYGPTECCVDNTTFLLSKDILKDIDSNIVPIGTPLTNQNIYVLDKNLNFVPFGVIGEIYISGNGIGRGYLKNHELNNSKFIQDPFNEELIMYKTGDLGIWNHKGYVECIGRIDSQVKIRGYRIELEEIENTILAFKKEKKTVNSEVITCKKCLMTSQCPGVSFNDNGVCNICEEYEGYKQKVEDYFRDIDEFKWVMNKALKDKKGEYDCILLYSGGKDSTYVLYQLVEMGYRVLAFTFDNGYISERAFKNIKRITDKLGVDSIIQSHKNMNEIFLESLKHDSTVCSGCFKALTAVSTKIAFENHIKVIVTGLSRGQIMDTKLQEVMKADLYDKDSIDNKLLEFRKVYHSINDKTNELLGIKLDNNKFENTYFIDFFRYANSSSEAICKYLLERDKEWSAPEDTGFCSSNCLINDVGIYVHLKNRQFHNYMIPLSWDCRLGLASKENASKELDDNLNMESINIMIKELGYEVQGEEEQVIKQVVVLDKLDTLGNKYLVAYYTSKNKVSVVDIRKFLMEKLPDYEVPSFYVQVKTIPKTSNGKIDKNELLKMRISGCSNSKFETPRNKTEEVLVDIWGEILQIDNIGVKDSFFELGGHSINAMVLVSKIQKQFNINILITDILELVTIENIAKCIDDNKFTNQLCNQLRKVDEKEFYPVSSSQKRMFVLQSLNPLDTAYNVQVVKEIRGKLDVEKLEKCFISLIKRHEALRTSFKFNEDEVVQVINEDVDFNIEIIEKDNKNIDKLIENFVRPFDLSKSPLIRAGIIECRIDEYIMILDIHHICTDAITCKILLNELSLLYSDENLIETEFQYKDFACWQRDLLGSTDIKRQKEYWHNNLISYDLNKYIFSNCFLCHRNEGRLRRAKFKIGNALKIQLENLNSLNEVTMYMTSLTAYIILLHKFSKEDDIVIGTPIAGRHYAKLENIVGVFINTLAIRSCINHKQTIKELLNEVKRTVHYAFKNQDYPFDNIVEDLNIQTSLDRNPLFNTIFSLNNINYKDMKLSQMEISDYEIKSSKPMVDLALEGEILEGELIFTFEYNDMIFSRPLIDKLIYNYIKILRNITKCEINVDSIELEDFNV